MNNPLFRPLEELLNRGIRTSPDAVSLVRRLAGRQLLIDPRGLPGSLLVTAGPEGLTIDLTDGETAADCIVRGLPLSLVRTGLSGNADALRQGAAEVAGDPAVAQDFRRLMDMAAPDWEEELSRVFGDVVAHQVGNVARGLLDWGRRTAGALAKDGGEFLTEETRQLPTRFEMEEFLDEVDRLRDDVGRLEARLNRIAARRSGERG